MMMRFAIAVAGTMLAVSPTLAADPVALVEDANGPLTAIGPMDYLAEGQKIDLPKGASIVIGYFASCMRETINGGLLKVGRTETFVEGGSVSREKVECDGGRMLLTADQSKKSGVMAFRGFAPGQKLPEPQLVVYGASPVFELSKPSDITIQRLDRTSREIELKPLSKDLVRGRFFDLAKTDQKLEPGALYRVTTDDREVVFRVDPNAKPGRGNLIGRLIKL